LLVLKNKIALLIVAIFTIHSLFAQTDDYGFPFVKNYTPKQYVGNNQNFAIAQDNKGIIYVGNNPCILSFAGNRWKATDLANISPCTSLDYDSINGVLYAGAIDDFGYLSLKANGQESFSSLRNLLPKKYKIIDKIWYTFATNQGVYFISNFLVIRFKDGKCKVWESNGLFHTAFKVNNKIIIRYRGEGLKVIEGDEILPIEGSEIFKEERVDFILPYQYNNYLLGSRGFGLYTLNLDFLNKKIPTCKLDKIYSDCEPFLIEKEITKAIQLKNKNYAIGTAKGGAIILDRNLKIISSINDNTGLQDLKVHHLFEDSQNNLWLALNNGISCIEVNSPFRNINSKNGLKGTVYGAVRYKEDLFFSTSQGLFQFKKSDYIVRQILKKPTECWDLIEFKKENKLKSLIVATKDGVIEIDGGKQNLISENPTYKLYQSKKFKNTLYLGLFSGFEILQNQNGVWQSNGYLDDFDADVKDIEEDDLGNLWISTNIDGLRYLENQNYVGKKPKFTVQRYDTSDGLPLNSDNYIRKINDKFVICTSSNFYKINTIRKGNKKFFRFKQDNIVDFPKSYTTDITFLAVREDANQNIWLQVFNNDLLYCETGIALKTKSGLHKWFTKPFKRFNDNIQFKSILPERNGVTWFSGSEGTFSFNWNTKFSYNKPFACIINYVFSAKDTLFKGEYYNLVFDKNTKQKVNVSAQLQPQDMKLELNYSQNNVTFLFDATNFISADNNKFSYYLEGNNETWADWTKKTEKYYTNLSEGTYIFHIKAKDIYDNVSKEITYEFTILPPWYRTILAYIIYFILGVILIFLVVKIYTQSLKRIIDTQTSELRQQNKEIEHKNKEITDSIYYAKKIQEAIMPSSAYIKELFADSFVLFKPKDIVSGDFYWASQKGNKVLLAAADCTGHGVPGAFMSMLGNDNLNEVVNDRNILMPNEILDGARLGIIKALKQKGESGENKDGMDIVMLAFDKDTLELDFASANNPLYIIRKNSTPAFPGYVYNIVQEKYSLLEIKGNKFPVGIYINNELPPFTNHKLQLYKGDTVYVFSDGFADQFGGPLGKKFKYNQLKELLLTIQEMPMREQNAMLGISFLNWRGNLEQVDDVLVIGLRIT